jgi:hypothetical protein
LLSGVVAWCVFGYCIRTPAYGQWNNRVYKARKFQAFANFLLITAQRLRSSICFTRVDMPALMFKVTSGPYCCIADVCNQTATGYAIQRSKVEYSMSG